MTKQVIGTSEKFLGSFYRTSLPSHPCPKTKDQVGHLGINNAMLRAQVNGHHLGATVWTVLRNRIKRRERGREKGVGIREERRDGGKKTLNFLKSPIDHVQD